MSESMSSEELQQLIAGYVLYDLSPEEAAIVEQLMADNPAIAQEVARMQATLELVYMPPAVAPPDHLRHEVLSASLARTPAASVAADERPSSSVAQIARGPIASIDQRRWLTGLGAAAALLIVGLGISNYVLWRSLQAARAQLQTAETFTVALQPTEASNGAAATITIDPTNLEARLEVENLPPLPEGQVYVLWTVLQPDAPFTVDEKNAILTEVFTVNGAEGGAEPIPLPRVYRDRQWIKAIAVTIEAANAPQHHVSSPILLEQL